MATKDKQLLGLLAPFSLIDDELIAAILGQPRSAEELLGELPLVDRTQAGKYKLHALWKPILASVVTEKQTASALKDGASYLLDKGDHLGAAQAFSLAGDEAGVVSTAVAICSMPLTGIQVDSVSHILSLVSGLASQGLEAALEAIVALASNQPSACKVAEVATGMVNRFEIYSLLMAGSTEEALARVGQLAVFGELRGRLLAETLLIDAGWPERVTGSETAEPADGQFEIVSSYAAWLTGALSPDAGFEVIQELLAVAAKQRTSHQVVLLYGVGVLGAISSDNLPVAHRWVQEARAQAAPAFGSRVLGFVDLGDAALSLHHGDEKAASEGIERLLKEVPLGEWPQRVYLHALAALYILAPGTRPLLARIEVGPALRPSIDAATALVEFRETGGTDAAAELDWEAADLLRTHIWPAHLIELALAATEGGNSTAGALLGALPGRRPQLEHLVERGGKIKEAAITALNELPAGPGYVLRLNIGSDVYQS